MSKVNEENKFNLSAIWAYNDICKLKENAKKLLDKGKVYNQLLHHIINNPPSNSLKSLSTDSKLPYSKITSHILKIYGDIIESITNGESLIWGHKTVHFFCLHAYPGRTFLCVPIEHLPYPPSVSDNVTFHYFQEYVGTSSFFVSRIDHDFKDGTQEIYYSLETGFYSQYTEYEKDKYRNLDSSILRQYKEEWDNRNKRE